LIFDGRTVEAAEIVIPWMIWEDKIIPFEKDGALEDENKSDEIYDETLIDNPDRPYNLFPLNPWMILWMPPLFDEMISIWKRLDHRIFIDDEIDMMIPFQGGKTFDERILEDESDGICDEMTLNNYTLIDNPDDPYNLFPLNY
jgi:hypothetical protein